MCHSWPAKHLIRCKDLEKQFRKRRLEKKKKAKGILFPQCVMLCRVRVWRVRRSFFFFLNNTNVAGR